MKRLTLALPALLLAALACGCGGKKEQAPQKETAADSVAPGDSSVHGVCGDGTSMHSLQLLHGGDTLIFALGDGDKASDVQGGLTAGDSMAVAVGRGGDVKPVDKVVNVTSLLGRWAALDRQFTLLADGRVQDAMKEPRPCTRWQLHNCRLVLAPDTFDIVTLGPDSLYLAHGADTLGYRRVKR